MTKFVIDENSVVIDGRGMQKSDVATIGEEHFGFVRRDLHENGDSGMYIGPSPFHKYHVKSVCEGVYVVSRVELQPHQTREMVQKFLDTEKQKTEKNERVPEEVCGSCGWEGKREDCLQDIYEEGAGHIYCPNCDSSI